VIVVPSREAAGRPGHDPGLLERSDPVAAVHHGGRDDLRDSVMQCAAHSPAGNASPVRLPPLHSAFDRELVAQLGAWEVRRHAEHDPRFAYFAQRTFLHLQLWHPDEHISVLTASRLTGGRFEIATGDRRVWVETWPQVLDELPGSGLPGGATLGAIMMWLVVRAETAAVRSKSERRPRANTGETDEGRLYKHHSTEEAP
jgi:hypothetical protein